MKNSFGQPRAAMLLLLALLVPLSLCGQTVVIHPEGHDVSPPLREMAPVPPMWENFNLHVLRPLPSRPIGGPDGALQTAPLPN